MNQPKHTPEPWMRAGPLASHILDSQGRCIADVPHPNGMSAEEGYANADLVAAAPKLLRVAIVALALHPEWDDARIAITQARGGIKP